MRRTSVAAVLFAMIILVSISVAPPIHAAPTLSTDQALYTQRDKQVTLMGSGYTINQLYHVWTKSPTETATLFSGTSFTPDANGLIPPIVTLPISAESPLGTHLVSVSTSSSIDDSQAIAHYGIWGPVTPLVQRTLSVSIMGGGLFPGTSFKLTIRNPAGNFVYEATLVSDPRGDFNHTWRIPEDAITDVYTIFVDGTGIFDDAQKEYVSVSKFTVTQAIISVNVAKQPKSSYERTETAHASFVFKYPDESPVTKSMEDTLPIVLLQNQTSIESVAPSLVDAVNGVWKVESKIPVNATLSMRYRFELPAMSFDDSYGNKGGSADVFSDYFEVRNATILLTTEINGTEIQVPFGQVSLISKVAYPDGTLLLNGTVRVLVSSATSTSELRLTYDPVISAWRTSYSTTLSDLFRIGTWRLSLYASDAFGNSGTATYEVSAQPYLFAGLLALLTIAALLGRWTISRYGRRLYFRIRKLTQKFRRRSGIVAFYSKAPPV